METLTEKFTNNRTLSLSDFCGMLKIPQNEGKGILPHVENSYNDSGAVVVHLHHRRTLEWIIREINLLFETDLKDREAVQLANLANAARHERHKIISMEKRVFDAPRRIRLY
jgi:hypothetical protein